MIGRADKNGPQGDGVNVDVSFTLNTIDRHAVMAFAQNQREEVRNVGDKAVSLAAEVGMHCQTFVALDMSHACDVIRDCGEIAPSLQARMGTGGNQVPLTYQDVTGTLPVQNMVVRRLTPLECERLQGYPDGWTDIGEWCDSKGKRHKDADSPRYKAMGNSIAIPPWKWVCKRLCACYERDATMASLFDGIGGFPYIWEQLNGKGSCLWASEIEEFPIAVTKLRFGGEDNGGQEVLLAEAEA